MVWATGITAKSGRFVGEVVAESQQLELVELERLGLRGVPVVSCTTKRSKIVTNFSDWRQVPATQYLQALNASFANVCESHHTVWEFEAGRWHYQVPALVLMRALFGPARFVLPLMFKPHGIERVCHLDHTASPVSVVIEAGWATEGSRHNPATLREKFTWFTAFPSARAMAASVHENALQGNVGLELPIGQANVKVTGIAKGTTFYVTEMSVLSVTTSELSTHSAHPKPSIIQFRDVFTHSSGTKEIKTDAQIPVRSDGSVELTDDEWDEIRPILLKGFRQASAKLDQRAILDGVLTKLAKGSPWNNSIYRLGSATNALYAYRAWTKRGTFQVTVERLRELRGFSN